MQLKYRYAKEMNDLSKKKEFIDEQIMNMDFHFEGSAED